MRKLLVLLVLLGCKEDNRAGAQDRALAAKEQALEAAQQAAEEAKQAMERAKSDAAEAWQRLEAARAEHAKVVSEHEAAKSKLAEVREEAAKTVAIAKQKLVDLGVIGAKLDRKIAAAKQTVASATGDAKKNAESALTELETKREQLTTEITRLIDMIAEIETTP